MHREETNEGDTLFMIDETLITDETSLTMNTQEALHDETWYLDSRCSNHKTSNRGIFIHLDETEKKEVRTGDDKKLRVLGIGDIIVNTSSGERKISQVYFVPGLKHNLLSVGQLLQKCHVLSFEQQACTIKDQKGNLIGKINMTANKMFPIRFKDENLFSSKTTCDPESSLWQQRFGHTNLGYLNYMHKHNLVRGIPNIKRTEEVCESCILGKHFIEDSLEQVTNTSLPSLMISQRNYGCTSSKKNQKHLTTLEFSKTMLKTKVVDKSKHLGQMEEVNMSQTNFKNFSKNMASRILIYYSRLVVIPV
ncbi:hypothetical protein LXL04_033499 [Taraxacum kok-saghyz]